MGEVHFNSEEHKNGPVRDICGYGGVTSIYLCCEPKKKTTHIAKSLGKY